MRQEFRSRGYPQNLINQHKERVMEKDRVELLQRPNRVKELKRIPFVMTYNDLSPTIGKIIRKHWPIMSQSYPQVSEFKSSPLLSYRRPPSLKDKLVKSEVRCEQMGGQQFLRTQKMGSYPCLNCIN